MPNQDYSFPYWNKRTGAYLGAIALGLSTLLLPGCTDNNEEIREGKTNVTAGEVSTLSGDAANAIGKMVTVRSERGQAVGRSGFVLTPENGQPILVINATGTPFTLPGGNIPVQATGQVETFVAADIDKKYGLNLEPNLYINYAQKPVIIAQSLALAPTPEDLYKAPAGYFDKVIAVEGEVRKLPDLPNSLAIFEDGWVDDVGILVIGVDPSLPGGPLSAIQEGEKIVVTGVARNVNVLAQKAQDLKWNDSQVKEFETRYTKRPVIEATKIYPSAVDNK